ncbi:metallophosphoesterase [Longispora sp. K20-0274]|uniref:hypothetical protein n=1 Tax=Longispora sp. K20-0274 TaxID=3088255 RepID=UPI00399A8B73
MFALRKVAIATGLAVAAVVGVAATGQAAPEDGAKLGWHKYTVGLFGDVNYGNGGRSEFAALADHINAANVNFSIYDGDLKNGKERCDNAMYADALARFDAMTKPVVVLPGDNDWTDCHRANNGAYDPIERLDYERSVFYSTPYSQGRKPMKVERQPAYPENNRFTCGPVTYLGLNVQGSNDNFPHAGVDGEARPAAEIARQDAEHTARLAANLTWLRETFAQAKARGDQGVVVVWQADPNFNNEGRLADPRSYDGFTEIVAALRAEVLAFKGQVALVHGDAHYYKQDKPLTYDNGQVIGNFTRVETFGDLNSHWVSLTVDPHNPDLFTFAPQIVPANVHDR